MTDQQEANEPMQPLRRKAGSDLKRRHESARPAGLCHMANVSLSEGPSRKDFWAWGSAQVIENAQFGEGNPRIFLG